MRGYSVKLRLNYSFASQVSRELPALFLLLYISEHRIDFQWKMVSNPAEYPRLKFKAHWMDLQKAVGSRGRRDS